MSDALQPLAEKLRPKNFDEIIGHDKILSKTGSLKRIIKKAIVIFYTLGACRLWENYNC